MSKATQITTGRCRLSYVSVLTPKVMQDGAEKYSVTLLIPKEDTHTLDKIKRAQNAAIEEFKKKNPGKRLPAKMPTTLHDGDGLKENGDEYGPECAGCMVMSTNSKRKPVVVYADKTPLTDEQEIYSGCYGRAVLNFYVYEHTGKIGVSAGLNGVMKVSDGEPLAGGIVTDADWDDIDDDEYGADLL